MNNIISPNMLKTYDECPFKYYLRYIQQISAPQKETPFEKGKKIHALANYYLKGYDISKLERTLSSEEFSVWQKLKTNEFYNKTYVNSEYNLSCKTNGYWIGGRIDAIVKDENTYYILDYKTGSIPKEPAFDYQTMIYLLAAKKRFTDIKTFKFVYIDLKNNQNHIIELTDDLSEEYEKRIKTILDKIDSTKDFSKTCTKYCEFFKLCRFS